MIPKSFLDLAVIALPLTPLVWMATFCRNGWQLSSGISTSSSTLLLNIYTHPSGLGIGIFERLSGIKVAKLIS